MEAQLTACSSRAEAAALLAPLSKSALVAVAKEQKIHAPSSARKDELVAKIIEFTVGSRLRREAFAAIDLSR